MRTIEVKLYKFEELSDKAKEKARDWWRELASSDDFEMEPFETAAKLLGITFAQSEVKLMSGKSRYESDIRFSGWGCQGDGASFVGSYEYAKGCRKAIRKEFPTDTVLHRIADELTELQRKHGYKLTASISLSGSYVHKYSMDIEVENHKTEEYFAPSGDTAKQLTELMRDFAQWIYDGLTEEHEYRMSDENVDDAITANEYEFTEDGERA